MRLRFEVSFPARHVVMYEKDAHRWLRKC